MTQVPKPSLRRPEIIPALRVRASLLRRGLQRRRAGNQPLWSRASEFDQAWKIRIQRMAQFIDRPGGVVDFGCGPMWLEQYVPPANRYVPVDYIRRDERTTVVDLNRDRLPALDASVGFLSGVLEYVRDVQALVKQLEDQPFTRLIVSYNTLERVPRRAARESVNWVSHLDLEQLLALFCAAFALVHIEASGTNTILVFDRKKSPGLRMSG